MAVTYDISGQLMDSSKNETLPFATVVPLNSKGESISNVGAVSDINGKFILKIPTLSVTNPTNISTSLQMPVADKIKVSFIGYETKIIPLKAGQKSYNIDLKPSNEQLKEFTVSVDSNKTSCQKNGGYYDESTKSCISKPVNKKNRTALYVGIGLFVAVVITGVIVYKYKKK